MRYAICGVSNRGLASFALPLLGASAGEDTVLGYGRNDEDYSAHGTLVAALDSDEQRAQDFVALLQEADPSVKAPVVYTDIDALIAEAKPDALIVATPDDTHEQYVLAGLKAGLRVIVEKPMTSTAAAAARVLEAERRSDGEVLVTHNLRYTARHRLIKQLLLEGAVGRVVQVNLQYFVDVRHGASYFLRWNRQRMRSGGLSVHKSTHHIDLVNWWLGAEPEYVVADGGRAYYGPDSPHRPLGDDGQPLVGRALRERDPYFQAQHGSGAFPDDADEARTGLFGLSYHEQYPAGHDEYLYDDVIDIEDHFSALIGYPGATLSYNINFSSPWEGYRLVIAGTHGQLETSTGRTVSGEAMPGTDQVIVRPLFDEARVVPIEHVRGGHEGADPLLRRDLFEGVTPESEALGMVASSREGAVAVAAGEALWRSIIERRIVTIEELLP